MADSDPTPRGKLTRNEVLLALLAGAAMVVIALALFHRRTPGDGSALIGWFVKPMDDGGSFTFWYHLGYAWLARGVAAAGAWLNPRQALELTSALGAGATVCLAYLSLRRLRISKSAATWATLLLALSPAMAQHATTIEVHTVQLSAGLLALLVMARSGEAESKALFGASLIAGLLVAFAHQTGPLLFPGLVLASFWTHEQRRFSIPRFCTCAGGFVTAIAVSRVATRAFSPFTRLESMGDFVAFTEHFTKDFTLGFVFDELILGLPALLALAATGLALGLAKSNAYKRRTWLALALTLVPYGFFFAFGERTDCGYFLGTAPGLLLLVALTLDSAIVNNTRLIRALAVLAILITPGFTYLWYHAPSRAGDNARAGSYFEEVHAALPEGGTLYTLQYNELTIAGQGSIIDEVGASFRFKETIEKGEFTPDVVARFMVEIELPALNLEPGKLLVDWTWDPTPLHVTPKWQAYIDAVRVSIDKHWIVEELPGDYGLFLRLSPLPQTK